MLIKKKHTNKLINTNFVLASTSDSRYRILKNAGLAFSRSKPICDEAREKTKMLIKKTSPKKISLELARIKSKSISKKTKDKMVVGSDTVIFYKKKIFDKAKNLKEAKKKITELSGNNHQIYSSISVFYNNKEVWKTSEKTTIKIRNLTEKEINEYLLLTGKKILKSVGCYQVEGLGPHIIENIKGDFFNVMGFPLFSFLNFLKKVNIQK